MTQIQYGADTSLYGKISKFKIQYGWDTLI